MVDKELIENWRNMLKPAISSRLLKTNYEGMGEQDKEEFERDFDEFLDLALTGLKYKAQLLQERTKSHAETHSCDLIDREAAIDALKKNTFRLTFAEEQNCEGHVAWSAEAVYSDVMEGALLELPSAQLGQRYTNEELMIFQHGISLSLLSKRSAQHWRYDENTTTEIKFLERLYEKVSANMRGGQDG